MLNYLQTPYGQILLGQYSVREAGLWQICSLLHQFSWWILGDGAGRMFYLKEQHALLTAHVVDHNICVSHLREPVAKPQFSTFLGRGEALLPLPIRSQ